MPRSFFATGYRLNVLHPLKVGHNNAMEHTVGIHNPARYLGVYAHDRSRKFLLRSDNGYNYGCKATSPSAQFVGRQCRRVNNALATAVRMLTTAHLKVIHFYRNCNLNFKDPSKVPLHTFQAFRSHVLLRILPDSHSQT